MSTLDTRRLYADASVLFASYLDAMLDDIEAVLNGFIEDANIANNSITASSKLIDGTITAAKIASNAITTVKITDANVTRAKIEAAERIPTGTLFMTASTTVPTGWLAADGSAVSRTTYATLFAEISTTWGVGDGSTTFNLPNGNGKTLIGNGNYTDSVSGSVTRTLGTGGGAEKHVIVTGEMASHSHTMSGTANRVPVGTGLGGTGAVVLDSYDSGAVTAGYNIANVSIAISAANTGSGTAHNNMQPYLVGKMIIKY